MHIYIYYLYIYIYINHIIYIYHIIYINHIIHIYIYHIIYIILHIYIYIILIHAIAMIWNRDSPIRADPTFHGIVPVIFVVVLRPWSSNWEVLAFRTVVSGQWKPNNVRSKCRVNLYNRKSWEWNYIIYSTHWCTCHTDVHNCAHVYRNWSYSHMVNICKICKHMFWCCGGVIFDGWLSCAVPRDTATSSAWA